eukprot:755168-Hanusia_phi.AAC.6
MHVRGHAGVLERKGILSYMIPKGDEMRAENGQQIWRRSGRVWQEEEAIGVRDMRRESRDKRGIGVESSALR